MASGEFVIKVVLWDGDVNFTAALGRALSRSGVRLTVSEVPEDVDGYFAEAGLPLLLAGELDCPFQNGNLLLYLRRNYPDLPVLAIVGRPSIDGAVSSIRAGALDYLLKNSFTIDELADRIAEIVAARIRISDRQGSGELLSRDPGMIRMLRLAQKAAASRATVLIQGESGTGKELLARFIHRQSSRAQKTMVAINCAALPENLLESELFGFEKGAFTGATQRRIGKFEQADGSTLLLDELGEMALPLQSKLLRVIQEGEVDRLGGRQPVPVDVRIIATTNRDLQQEVEAGNFRQDLFFRLNVIPLTIPPLRERPQDVELLLDNFIASYSRLNQRDYHGVSEAARRFLLSYDYPGNVRELENMVERAVVLGDGPRLELADFFMDSEHLPEVDRLPPLPEKHCASESPEPKIESESLDSGCPSVVGTTLAEVERYMIFKTLREVDDNRTHAAARLGISIRTLRNKLKEYRDQEVA